MGFLQILCSEITQLLVADLAELAEWALQDDHCNESGGSFTCGQNASCNHTASESGYHCYCNSDCEGNPYLNGDDGCRNGAGWAVLAATLRASSYRYWPWASKKATMKLTSKLLKELHDKIDLSSPDIPVDPDMGDGDPSFFDGDGDPDSGDGGIDANIDDPNAVDQKPWDFNQQDLKKAIKLYQTGRRIAIWASRRRVARADLPGQGPVDIRKFTVEERSQLPLFVKGVQTLSRIVIHANVAHLLGISVRERSLIYMPFSDRTLHDSLHNSPSDRRPSWEERLKIALGTARGLAFAHSKGLYHGNVKSSNILLDEKCNCKLVEFGVARVWSKNTLLNSSRGYVDQEYMNSGTNQLIASMDVYSFGVLLVELITGQDPSSEALNRRGSSLALVFISAVYEGRLQEVVDHNIWAEERNEQLLGLANLAKECLQQGGKGRPKMLQVINILSKWVPKGPGPQAQGGRPTNAAGSRPRVARNSNLQDQIGNAQSQAQSALDVGQNITAEFET